MINAVEGFAKDIEVIHVTGVVNKIDSAKIKTKIEKGMWLQEADTIITDIDSTVILKIPGHSLHKIESDSKIKIQQLPYQFEKSQLLEQGASFFLEKGTILSDILEESDIVSMQISTKFTRMHVRGTTLMVTSDTKTDDVWLSVKSGEVEVKNDKSTHHDVVISGQTLTIEQDRRFTKIQEYNWIKQINWNFSNFGRAEFKDSSNFKRLRSMAYKEFEKKRAKWVRDEKVWQQKNQMWQSQRDRWTKNTSELSSNKIRLERKDKLRRQNRKFKDKKIYKNLFKKSDTIIPNEFVNDDIDN